MTAAELAERYLLALCIWREARGEPYQGKELVASVIRNRKDDTRWPDTYTGVITQPKQFSAFNAGDPNVTLYPLPTDKSWEDCVQAAEEVIANGAVTTGNHYHVIGLKPTWADPTKVVATVGHHVFYHL